MNLQEIPQNIITNKERPETQKPTSGDLFHSDRSQHDRNTEKMGEYHKHYEGTHFQGNGKTSPNFDNAPAKKGRFHGDQVAQEHQPRVIFPKEWKPPIIQGGSTAGVSLAYLTVDTEEDATRFIKELYKRGLISQAQVWEHGFKRTYLKFGRKYTEEGRYKLEMEVPDRNVEKLISFINENNPTNYDYPVPDAAVIPISEGNKFFLKWARRDEKINFDTIYDPETKFYESSKN